MPVAHAAASAAASDLDPVDAAAPSQRVEAAEREAMALEDRPTGDFIDGFLAGVASANAALDANPAARYFYSFDWIGDGEEERAHALHAAFQSDESGVAFEVSPPRAWRDEAAALGGRWLGRALPPTAAAALVEEFVELLAAFLADMPVEAFRIRPAPPSPNAPIAAAVGAEHDYLLLETPEGRLLLEFSVDL